MDVLNSLKEIEIAGNQLWRIVALLVIILFAFVAGKVIKAVLTKSATRLEGSGRFIFASAVNAIARSSILLSFVLGFCLSLTTLKMSAGAAEALSTVSAILVSSSIGYLAFFLVDVPGIWLAGLAEKAGKKLYDMLIPIIRKGLRITVVIFVLVQIAQILSDKPITSIIAGLGIGGLAVALAAQDSIKNIFGSIVLFVDKPFEMGDRIVIDGHDGPVEEVGLRSTKIRTLEGHLVTVPNGELANKTIQNIGKRPYIKKTLNLTITYDTPMEKIDRAISIVKDLLNNHEGMNKDFPPRVYFSDFNLDSLNIMVIYWYHPPDYWKFMDFNERFNMEVLSRFNDEGISFAFPTRTLYLADDPSRPFTIGVRDETGSLK